MHRLVPHDAASADDDGPSASERSAVRTATLWPTSQSRSDSTVSSLWSQVSAAAVSLPTYLVASGTCSAHVGGTAERL